MPLRRIQEWLGHSTIHMAMRYGNLAPSADADFLATLDANVAAAPRAIERRRSSS